MSIVKLNEVLVAADKGKYGVGAFNTLNIEMTKGIIQAAEEEKSPVIIQIAELLFPFMPDWEAVTVATLCMARKAKVPVVVHLDHGMTFDNIVKAMHMGFSGVMIDGSHLSFDENVKQTQEIVKIAHVLGIPVEAELGTVPGEEGVYSAQVTIMTDVDLAAKYIELTRCDALAVCIGNAHGNYIKTPKLDLTRLEDIKRVSSNVPLVLHGGSGLTDDDFRKCIKLGISKVNIFTDLCNSSLGKLNALMLRSSVMQCQPSIPSDEKLKATNGSEVKPKEVSYPQVMSETIEAVKSEAIKKIRLFGSSNKA